MEEDSHTFAQQQHVRLNNAKTNIFHLCHMKGHHEADITFHQETQHQPYPVFMLVALKKVTAKTYFLHHKI